MHSFLVWVAGGPAAAALSLWFGYVLGVRRERAREARGRNQVAAGEVTRPLRELQSLLRRHGTVGVEASQVARASSDWSVVWDNHRLRLPEPWHHLSRSVRDAAGTALGGVAFVHLRPDASELPLEPPDAMWQDYADEYLGYLVNFILDGAIPVESRIGCPPTRVGWSRRNAVGRGGRTDCPQRH